MYRAWVNTSDGNPLTSQAPHIGDAIVVRRSLSVTWILQRHLQTIFMKHSAFGSHRKLVVHSFLFEEFLLPIFSTKKLKQNIKHSVSRAGTHRNHSASLLGWQSEKKIDLKSKQVLPKNRRTGILTPHPSLDFDRSARCTKSELPYAVEISACLTS